MLLVSVTCSWPMSVTADSYTVYSVLCILCVQSLMPDPTHWILHLCSVTHAWSHTLESYICVLSMWSRHWHHPQDPGGWPQAFHHLRDSSLQPLFPCPDHEARLEEGMTTHILPHPHVSTISLTVRWSHLWYCSLYVRAYACVCVYEWIFRFLLLCSDCSKWWLTRLLCQVLKLAVVLLVFNRSNYLIRAYSIM